MFLDDFYNKKNIAEGFGDMVSNVATKVGDTLANALPKEMQPFNNDTAAKTYASFRPAKNPVKENTGVTKHNDYDRWSDEVSTAGGEIYPQKDRVRMVAQSWDGDTMGEFNLRTNQGWINGQQGVAKGLNEFAPPGSDDGGDDGFSEETLKRLAAQWWNGDEDPRVEKILAAAGWEIGQDEGGYDNGGAFVVQAGDVNGNSYMSWPAEELEQGVAEGKGDFAQAIDNLSGWHEEESDNPDIRIWVFDDREGGWYAQGTVYHNVKTGRVKIEFEDRAGEHSGDVNDTFDSIGDAMKVLKNITVQIRSNTGKAQDFDKLGGRTVAGPDDLYKTDRVGKKGTLNKTRMDIMKAFSPYRKTGPEGQLPESGVAEATGDPKFDKMLKGITGKRQVAKQQKADTKQQARDAFGGMFGGGNPADSLGIRKKSVDEGSELPPNVVDMIKKIAQSSAAPEHKKAMINALIAKYSNSGVAETYGAELHTKHKRNRFKQIRKIKQTQNKAFGLSEAGCNMTESGRACPVHGMNECPGYEMTETSAQDKLHQRHQEIRKKSGLPHPDHYLKMMKQKQAEIDALKAEIESDKSKGLGEARKPDYNFDIEDIKKLERIRDLPTLKTLAFDLISKPSAKPMKPEKVEWFRSALERMDSPLKVIKLMYDLMLSGEGHQVIGSRNSMKANSYRGRFSEQEDISEDVERYVEALGRAGYDLQEEKTRLDPKCWKGYKKAGTKMKGGVRVNNCVPVKK